MRICIISILIISCIYSTYYFHAVVKTWEGISHFYYIPILLSVIWWGKKGNIVAVFLAIMLVFGDHLFGIGVTKFFDYIRGIMLVTVSFFLTLLTITIENSYEKITNLNLMLKGFHNVNKLILAETDRDRLLSEICRALVNESGYKSIWIVIWDRYGNLISSAESGLRDVFPDFIKSMKSGDFPNCVKWALDQNDIILTENMKRDCCGCSLLAGYGDYGAMTLKMKNINYGHGILSVTVPRNLLFEKEARSLLIEISGIIDFSLKNIKLKKDHDHVISDLRESEERFREIIENAPFGYYRIGVDGIWQYVNPHWEKMYKTPYKEIIGKHYQMTLSQVEKMKIKECFENAQLGKTSKGEFLYQESGGVVLYYQYNSQPIYSQGKLVAIEGFLNDLTEVRKLQNEIMMITTRERQRIGQDLHDGLGQNLAAATFLLEGLGEGKNRFLPQIEKIHEIISGAIVQTKNLSRILCPVEMGKEGLVLAIMRMAESTEKIFNIRCKVFSDEDFQVDDEQTAIHLFYIAREAVNNAIRHGSAGNIEINLKSGKGGKSLSIKDDGSGSTGNEKNEGMGLYIMEYRSQLIGAEFFAGNHDEGGFLVHVRLNRER